MRGPQLMPWKLFAFSFAFWFSLSTPAGGEVILQYFESDWNEIYQRIPEIAETGYDAIWTPPPSQNGRGDCENFC
jgi:glycosidase